MGWGEVMCNRYRFADWEEEKVLEMDVVIASNNVNYSVLDKGFT